MHPHVAGGYLGFPSVTSGPNILCRSFSVLFLRYYSLRQVRLVGTNTVIFTFFRSNSPQWPDLLPFGTSRFRRFFAIDFERTPFVVVMNGVGQILARPTTAFRAFPHCMPSHGGFDHFS